MIKNKDMRRSLLRHTLFFIVKRLIIRVTLTISSTRLGVENSKSQSSKAGGQNKKTRRW